MLSSPLWRAAFLCMVLCMIVYMIVRRIVYMSGKGGVYG